MVATSLPTKPKLADEYKVDANEDLECSKTNDSGCCKIRLCWPMVKLLALLVILVFFSLFLHGEISAILFHMDNIDSEVKMSFQRPTQVKLPAITVCNNNPIQRSKFCRKYPEYCSNSTDENGLVFNSSSYRFVSKMQPNETVPLGQSWQEFVQSCLLVNSANENNVECNHVRNIYWSLRHQNCFTFICGKDNLTGDYRKAAIWMILDFQPEENIENHTIVGGQLFIHDKDRRIPEGFPISSYTLKPGKIYRYRLRQTNYFRLPPPWEPGCKDYEDEDSQVRSQEECYNSCLEQKFTNSCGCMPDRIPNFDVNHSTFYCKGDRASEKCVKSERRALEEACNDLCLAKCVEHTYEVKVDEFELPEYNSEIRDARRNIANIWIKFETNEQKTFRETAIFPDFHILFGFACLFGVVVLFLLFMVTGTILQMYRICKSGSNKNSAIKD